MIDSHLHIWDPDALSYEWLKGSDALNRRFGPESLDRGTSGVTGIVFVQADPETTQAVDEVEWVSSSDRSLLPVDGIVAFAALERGAPVQDELDALAQYPLVVGIRRNVQSESLDFIAQPSLADGIREVGRRGWTFDACLRWEQLPAVTALFRRLPEIDVVLDHVGKPPVAAGFDSDEAAEWRAFIREFAANERARVKLSGIAPEAGIVDDLAAAARPFLLEAVEVFGTARCMVGSDWPVSAYLPVERTYDSWFAIVLDGLGFSEAEREQVGTKTATDFYKLAR